MHSGETPRSATSVGFQLIGLDYHQGNSARVETGETLGGPVRSIPGDRPGASHGLTPVVDIIFHEHARHSVALKDNRQETGQAPPFLENQIVGTRGSSGKSGKFAEISDVRKNIETSRRYVILRLRERSPFPLRLRSH